MKNYQLVEYDGQYAIYWFVPGQEPVIEVLILDEYIEYCR